VPPEAAWDGPAGLVVRAVVRWALRTVVTGQVQPAGGFGRADELGERGDGGGVLPGGVVPGGVGLAQLLLGVADPVGGFQHQHVCRGLLAGAVLGGGEGDPLVVLAFRGARRGAGHGK